MAEDTEVNTVPDDELFDVEGEAAQADDDSSDAASADDPAAQVVDLDTGKGEPVPAESDDPDDSDDGESYGAKVTSRINKLTGHHNQAIAEKNREIAALKRQAFDAQGVALDANVASLTSRLEGINDGLKQAIEDGDTDKQLELNDELLDAKIELREAKGQKGRPSRPTAEPEGDGEVPAPTEPKDPLAALQPKAKGWAQRVGFMGWSDSQRGTALGIDSELTKEGFDQNTDDYFDELDRRLGGIYPDLYPQDDEPEPAPRPKVASNVRAPAPITPKPGANTGSKVKLDASDYANMRKFKLDPQNPEHVKAYAQQKRSG